MENHQDVVQKVKNRLAAAGVNFSGPCGAFEIVKNVAWELREEGAGLRRKPGGNVCEWNGVTYATDIISLAERGPVNAEHPDGWYPTGVNVDILADAGGANGPAWSPYEPDPNVIQYHQPALDPTGGSPVPAPEPIPEPTPTPVPVPINTDHMIEVIQSIVRHNRDNIETLKNQVNQLQKNINEIQQAVGVLAGKQFPTYTGSVLGVNVVLRPKG